MENFDSYTSVDGDGASGGNGHDELLAEIEGIGERLEVMISNLR